MRLLCARSVSAAEAGAKLPVNALGKQVFHTLLRNPLRMSFCSVTMLVLRALCAVLPRKECSISVQLASAYGKLGNIDANTGDAQTGWDTDQFLTDPKEALLVAATILKQGGLAPGETLKLTSPCFLRSTHEYLLLPQAAGLLCQMSRTQTLELANTRGKDQYMAWNLTQPVHCQCSLKWICSTSIRMCAVTGGINFDAKLRRESTALVDLFYGHISGMDAMARALRNAAQMLEVRLHLLLPLTILNLDIKEFSLHGTHYDGQTERGT